MYEFKVYTRNKERPLYWDLNLAFVSKERAIEAAKRLNGKVMANGKVIYPSIKNK